MEKPQLILIRGLGHSGSTVLDLALSSHPQIVGVGEGIRVLRGGEGGPRRARSGGRHLQKCSCGADAATCKLWGELTKWLETNDDCHLLGKVNKLVEHLRVEGGGTKFVVDSSQSDMQSIIDLACEFDLRVIFLVRDYRSWVFSRTQKEEGSWIRHVLSWYRGNKRIEKRLSDSKVSYMLAGYEEFALRPEDMLRRICHYLNISFDERMLCPGRYNEAHALVGNRVRLKLYELERIKYDGSWLASASSSSFPFVHKVLRQSNARWVYSNAVLRRR